MAMNGAGRLEGTGTRGQAAQGSARGWLLYDGDCSICSRLAGRLRERLHERGFECAPLQAAWVRERLGGAESDLLREVRLLLANGSQFRGAKAVVRVAEHFWWGWPLLALARLPGGPRLLEWVYGWVARRRMCLAHAGLGHVPFSPIRARAFWEMP